MFVSRLPCNTERKNFESVGPVTENTGALMMVDKEPTPETNNLCFALQADEETNDGVPAEPAEAVGVETSQNVQFLDNDTGPSFSFAPPNNPIAEVDNTDEIALGDFLSRPTLINTTTWSTADLVGVKTTLTPWYLFLNSAAIKKKIDNYAFLRGQLHIKMILNGTPFQYGFMRACYSPMLGVVSDKIRLAPSPSFEVGIPYSQQPGFEIQPQANAGGQMTLPFFWHKNWLDITNATEVQNFGTLNYVIYAPLRVAVTGASTSVTLQTYAWMSDVQVMGTTSKLSLQSDEYVEGAISGPATWLANTADLLTKVPYIGKFARATQMGSSAVANIARLFGYTNVPVISEVHAFHPMNAPMLASANISVPQQKLTLDPKQELSIDPSLHGLPAVDELSLAYLKKKASFFGLTSWSTTDLIDSTLFNMRVNPALCQPVDILNASSVKIGSRVYATPLSYMNNLFTHWRGTLKIRIKVVATKFHKGRLKIAFDPLNDIYASSPSENTVYTQILDIGEQDDITIVLPYYQATAWMNTDHSQSANWALGSPLAPRAGIDNGNLTVRVLTNLTAPTSGSVNLLFWLEAGDDFEFANPTHNIGETKPISFFNLQADEHVEESTQEFTMGKAPVAIEDRYALNFGEPVSSLRSLLHRSSVSQTVWADGTAPSSFNAFFMLFRHMPPSPGYDTHAKLSANKIVAASGTAKYEYCSMHPISFISNMFIGTRGSTNIYVTPNTSLMGGLEDFRIIRYTGNDVWSNLTSVPRLYAYLANTATESERAAYASRYLDYYGGNSGMAITNAKNNGTLMVNVPDMKKYNFTVVDPSNWLIGDSVDGTDSQGAMMIANVSAGASTETKNNTFQIERSAGPDFQCLFFLCAPVYDVSSSWPVAA